MPNLNSKLYEKEKSKLTTKEKRQQEISKLLKSANVNVQEHIIKIKTKNALIDIHKLKKRQIDPLLIKKAIVFNIKQTACEIKEDKQALLVISNTITQTEDNCLKALQTIKKPELIIDYIKIKNSKPVATITDELNKINRKNELQNPGIVTARQYQMKVLLRNMEITIKEGIIKKEGVNGIIDLHVIKHSSLSNESIIEQCNQFNREQLKYATNEDKKLMSILSSMEKQTKENCTLLIHSNKITEELKKRIRI